MFSLFLQTLGDERSPSIQLSEFEWNGCDELATEIDGETEWRTEMWIMTREDRVFASFRLVFAHTHEACALTFVTYAR